MFRDIVVPVTQTAGDAGAVDAAATLAISEGAHLAILEFANLPILPAGPWGAGEIGLGEIYDTFRAQAEANATGWRQRMSKQDASLSCEVRVIESLYSESSNLAALHARYGDLAVMTMAADPSRDIAVIQDFFTSLLLESGAPVLLIPTTYAWRPAKHVVVAWRPLREAVRALRDAMPFLHRAESIDVVVVSGDGGDGAVPGVDIAAHLARHGLNVNVVTRPRHADSVALALVRHAQDTGAELIVAGGYGHSRFREWVLGGVTRELLSGICTVPVLFSH